MLEGLKLWPSDAAGEAVAAASCPPDRTSGVEDRRGAERFNLAGGEVYLFLDGEHRFRLRLRDVCSSGISGLTDAPLSMGQQVLIQFEETLMPTAEVVWSRRSSVGFQFINPLAEPRIRRLCDRHESGAAWSPAMRAGSDLHSWWTDPSEQESGRKPRLRSGGHKHPLPR